MTDTKSYKQIMAQLSDTVDDVASFCAKFGMLPGQKLSDIIDLVKTIAQYRRALRRAVLLFWRGDEDTFQFIDRMVYATDEQFRRAWREGMRDIGLDPTRDSRASFDSVLEDRITQEQDYVLGFAEAIRDARENDKPIDPLYSRVELWVNKYNEVRDLAKITYGKDNRYEWILGPTEHCRTCLELSTVVAFGSDWDASGWRPQSPDLECGGYRCQCSLNQTDKPPTGKKPQDVSK